MSQLDLASRAAVTPRHVSFVETGRAQPSREMVLTLADALEVPLRERNDLLLAAAYAPLYRETGLNDTELAHARFALERILQRHEPFPAVVMDRHWNLIDANAGAQRLFGAIVDLGALPAPVNVLRLVFDPDGIRPAIANWDRVAAALLERVHAEAVRGALDAPTIELLDELSGFSGVAELPRAGDLATSAMPYIEVEFLLNGDRLRYFSTVTTLGTPIDITLQEIRIECFHPADDRTEQLVHDPGAATAGDGRVPSPPSRA
jgi:transcriptional regulator with XRE-family HTH domain